MIAVGAVGNALIARGARWRFDRRAGRP